MSARFIAAELQVYLREGRECENILQQFRSHGLP